ncbi:hypothetical protein VTL71DRAFT_9261 [Oculimacula yallundae]|uniref:Uncharacterized protein n=1 Tax=Oculimacula yallundae TaxID=86028 RepID=A0ABR4BSJ2_9HELO
MANRTIYTRVYSESSAGKLVSGKGPEGNPLSNAALAVEFRNHAKKWSPIPTALVSGSPRIIDTLKRAFDKYYEDGESSADIWIAFIAVPPTTNETATRIHPAKELAERFGLPDPNKFSHEVVFEWAIPKEYVLHQVSLRTWIERGLQEHYFVWPSTWEAQCYIARKFQRHDPWEIGITLGAFARKFGARAPMKILNDDVVRLYYAYKHTEIVDLQFFCELDNGIDTALYDWWLSDIDSFPDYEEYEERRDAMEDGMIWDLIECWETWHNVDSDVEIGELSAEEEHQYCKERDKLFVEHERKKIALEREAMGKKWLRCTITLELAGLHRHTSGSGLNRANYKCSGTQFNFIYTTDLIVPRLIFIRGT